MPTFWLSGRLPGLNDVTAHNRANRYGGAKQKRDIERDLVMQIKAARINPIDGLCDWSFTWYEPNRRRDPDNIYSACKFIFDALQYAGKLPRDSWQYVGRITHDSVVSADVGVLVEFERRDDMMDKAATLKTITVIDGKVLVEQDGAAFWLTERNLRETIRVLQAELYKYQLMLDKLTGARPR